MDVKQNPKIYIILRSTSFRHRARAVSGRVVIGHSPKILLMLRLQTIPSQHERSERSKVVAAQIKMMKP